MPRQPRIEVPGGIHHVFCRGVNRRALFVDREDYARYTSLLAETVKRFGWHCLCYCLMPNHVHLLIETPEPNLGAGMQWLHGMYALKFNERHSRVGHLFQNRFRSVLIKDDTQFVVVVGYIVLNPVAADLCRRPEDWPWGSHSAVASDDEPYWLGHERLLSHLDDRTGARCYAELVAARTALAIDATLK